MSNYKPDACFRNTKSPTLKGMVLKLKLCIQVREGINPASSSVMLFNSMHCNTILVDYTCRLKQTFPWPLKHTQPLTRPEGSASTAVWSWFDPSSANRKPFECGAGFIHSYPDHRHTGYSVPVCLISWCTGLASDPQLCLGPCSR